MNTSKTQTSDAISFEEFEVRMREIFSTLAKKTADVSDKLDEAVQRISALNHRFEGLIQKAGAFDWKALFAQLDVEVIDVPEGFQARNCIVDWEDYYGEMIGKIRAAGYEAATRGSHSGSSGVYRVYFYTLEDYAKLTVNNRPGLAVMDVGVRYMKGQWFCRDYEVEAMGDALRLFIKRHC